VGSIKLLFPQRLGPLAVQGHLR